MRIRDAERARNSTRSIWLSVALPALPTLKRLALRFFTLALLFIGYIAEAQITGLIVARSIEVNQQPEVTANDEGEFEQTIEKVYISNSSHLPLSTQFASQKSGPFTGTHWKGEGKATITLPESGGSGAGANSRCNLAIQFTNKQSMRYDFSAGVTGSKTLDHLSFRSLTRPLNITHLSQEGQFSTSGVLPEGTYLLDMQCYAQDSPSDTWHSGSFYFELIMHPESCIHTKSFSIPFWGWSCNFINYSIDTTPQYANGRLELKCSGTEFLLLWHDVNGTTYYVGMCRYERGLNGVDYLYDNCANTVVEVRMSNAEGINASDHTAFEDGCNGRYSGLYETDHYHFLPSSKLLNYKKFTQRLNGRRPEGGFEVPIDWDFQPAPTSRNKLYELNFPLSDNRHCLFPDVAAPRQSLADIFGTARAGHVYLGCRNHTVGLWLQGGETPNQVSTALANLLNANTNFSSNGISSSVVAGPLANSTSLILIGAADEDLWFSVTGQGTNGMRFIKAVDYPVLKIQTTATATTLLWRTNSFGFVAETTTNPAVAQSWTALPGQPSATNGNFFLSTPPSSGNRFFRLKL